MNDEMVSHRWKPRKKRGKTFMVQAGLFLLGRALEAAAVLDPDVRREVEGWKDPMTIMLHVHSEGPTMVLKKQDGVLRYAGSSPVDADLTIFFKNLESAFLVFSAQMSSPQGSAEHRVSLKGDAGQAMSLIRCMETTQAYLFPKFIAKNVLKKVPPMTLKRAGVRAAILGVGVPIGLGRFAGLVR
ncbi:MAG: hypothetical protein JEZ02_10705 [Desulfatibacillum sp.]|nr:hypothetical protein [Desulfatibacillum sp.]